MSLSAKLWAEIYSDMGQLRGFLNVTGDKDISSKSTYDMAHPPPPHLSKASLV